MGIKIKVCGITNAQDALWAANLGADFIGLNFYSQSPRKVSPKLAKELVSQLPPFLTAVGLFVDEPFLELSKIVKKVPLKAVQLHGHETPEICEQVKALGVAVIKVIRLQGPVNLAELEPYKPYVDYFLFDTFISEVPGGTGETFDWAWVQSLADLGKPWFLAGGLNPANVGEAIKQVHPPAVDVCSGVERLPKRKDFETMKAFIQAVRAIR